MPKHAVKKRTVKKHTVQKSLLLSLGAIVVAGLLMFNIGKVCQGNNSHSSAPRSAKQIKKDKLAKKVAKIHLTKHEKKIARNYKLNKLETRTASKTHITAIGDSVMIDVKPDVKQVFRHSAVSGSVGRQFYSLPGIVRHLKATGHLSKYIVINLGINGPPTQHDINSVLKTVGKDRQIFWINTRVPRHWQNTTNRMISKNAKKHSNVHLVNWYKASKGHKSWYASDRVHLDLTGEKYYTRTLAKKVSDVLN